MVFLSRRIVYPILSSQSRRKTIVRTVRKQTPSNSFSFALDSAAEIGWFGLRRKTKNKNRKGEKEDENSSDLCPL